MYVGSNRRHLTSKAKLIGYSITITTLILQLLYICYLLIHGIGPNQKTACLLLIPHTCCLRNCVSGQHELCKGQFHNLLLLQITFCDVTVGVLLLLLTGLIESV